MTSHRARIVSDHCRWLASDETGMDIRSVVPSCPAYVAKYWHSVPESILAPVVCNFKRGNIYCTCASLPPNDFLE